MAIPRDGSLDSTLALLREGYEFISKRCDRLRSDAFVTRLMLHRAVCVRGADAARMFYAPGRFTRDGAMPPTALKLLQDRGSVNPLDGDAHRHRKAMFLGVLTPAATDRLAAAARDAWRARAAGWAGGEVVLFDELEGALCRAACAWAGVPVTEADADRRTREFRAMIDGSGSVGPRNWKGLLLRNRTERWARAVVARAQAAAAGNATPLAAVAAHRDRKGRLLPVEVAAVELINLLRPTVAVARYVVFAALALHDHPDWRERLRHGREEDVDAFVEEVRRFYPFFPLVGGRVREPFEWRGELFPVGTWVLLDLYGTNRDAAAWPQPDVFRPERFLERDATPFDFVPQGGGDAAQGHRCPGEGPTVALMKAAVRWLVDEIEYDVPEQDLSVNLARIPAEPASRFRIANVRPRPQAARVEPSAVSAS